MKTKSPAIKGQKLLAKALPCPFCGSKPKADFMADNKDRDGAEDAYWAVTCGSEKACRVAPPMAFGSSLREALKIWNTRTVKPCFRPPIQIIISSDWPSRLTRAHLDILYSAADALGKVKVDSLRKVKSGELKVECEVIACFKSQDDFRRLTEFHPQFDSRVDVEVIESNSL